MVWEPSGIGLTFVVIFILGYWVVGWRTRFGFLSADEWILGIWTSDEKNLTQRRKGHKEEVCASRLCGLCGLVVKFYLWLCVLASDSLVWLPLHRAVVIRERNRSLRLGEPLTRMSYL
jgi:hypothetical protein